MPFDIIFSLRFEKMVPSTGPLSYIIEKIDHRFFDFVRTDIRCSHLNLENLGHKQDVRFTRAVVSMPAVELEIRRIETRFIPESEHCPVNWTAFLLHYKWNQ